MDKNSNNDLIIADLYKRIVELEADVRELKEKDANKEKKLLKRKEAIELAKMNLKENNEKLIVENGNRSSGADIILKSEKNKSKKLKIKFFHSKSYEANYVSGWHTLPKSFLEENNIDIYIFNVAYQGEIYSFIFSQDELYDFVEDKSLDQNEQYHFYFRLNEKKVYEDRDGNKDASLYYNRWDLPSTILQ